MKLVKHEQGSSEWLQWRRSILTATDAAIITKMSPYSTVFELWQRKLGLIEEQKSNAAMERGSRLEPEARTWFNKEYNLEMEPCVIESDEFNFLGASLDGINKQRNRVLEIKCNGHRNHSLVKGGNIPGYHFAQIQHQLICTRAERCYYLSYTDEDKIVIEVEPDIDFENEYLPVAREFWRRIVYRDPPPHFILKEIS